MKIFLGSIFSIILLSGFSFAQENSSIENCLVTLKVEFLSSGKIGEVSLASTSCKDNALTNKALEVAKNIKFEPAIKAGKPITIVKNVNYTFAPIDEKAEAIFKKAVEKLGGEKYLQAKSSIGRGFYTQFKDGNPTAPVSFVDYVVFPDKNRTDFKSSAGKTVQANFAGKGWIADGEARSINDQTPKQLEDFRQAMRISLDNFLRGGWRTEQGAKLEYAGRREAGLGKRNDVLRLTYADGFAVEYEFGGQDSMPAKIIRKITDEDGKELKEEDRFAQFVENQGILTPFIIDRFRDKVQMSRVNYQSFEYNVAVPDALFVKPTDIKKLK